MVVPVCHERAGAGAVADRDALPASVLAGECGCLEKGLVGAAAYTTRSPCPLSHEDQATEIGSERLQ